MLLAAGATALAVVAAHYAVNSTQDQWAGTVTASAITPLNFETAGYIQTLLVQPGQKVRAGQVLATENTSVVQAQLTDAKTALDSDEAIEAADQSAVAADQARVKALLAPQVPSAQAAADALDVTKAEEQLSDAQKEQTESAAVESASVAQAIATLHAYRAQLSSDTSQMSEECPVMPPPQWDATRCYTLANEVSRDQVEATDEQGIVSVVQAEATRSALETSAQVSQAEFAVQLAQQEYAVQSAPASPSTVDDSESFLARDQAQVLKDQSQVDVDKEAVTSDEIALSHLAITAPTNGVVLAVDGEVGALADSSGVRQYGDQGAQSVQDSTGLFSVLPPAPEASRSTSTSSGELPVIEVRAESGWLVTARVPENELNRFPFGRHADVTIAAANVTGIQASVWTVEQVPVVVSGSVYYNVILKISYSTLPVNVLSGMTADVTLS